MDMSPPAKIPMARNASTRAGEPPEEKKPPCPEVLVDDGVDMGLEVDVAVLEVDMDALAVVWEGRQRHAQDERCR